MHKTNFDLQRSFDAIVAVTTDKEELKKIYAARELVFRQLSQLPFDLALSCVHKQKNGEKVIQC